MPASSPCNATQAWIRLGLEPGLKPAMLRKLLVRTGSAERIYTLSHRSLAAVVGETLAAQMLGSLPAEMDRAIEKTLAWAQHPNHHLLALDNAAYPALLLETHDPPALLYVVGDPRYLSRPAIAIVGARNATPGGLDNARAFARTLAQTGWCVVSGLAAGIDAAAHDGALAGAGGAGTVAVMGTGVDIIYPSRNRALAERIAAQGALVSEYALGMPALPHQFPRRNRLVAGLSRGVLIVEAAMHSGSLITARLAGDMGREVFAIPGSLHSPLSRGCHALIRQGATLIETAHDIVSELGGAGAVVQDRLGGLFDGEGGMVQSYDMSLSAPATVTAHSVDTRARTGAHSSAGKVDPSASLLHVLGNDPVHLDDLQRRLQWPAETVLAGLLALELGNAVVRLPGGRYQRRQ